LNYLHFLVTKSGNIVIVLSTVPSPISYPKSTSLLTKTGTFPFNNVEVDNNFCHKISNKYFVDYFVLPQLSI
jgi:hypothetical protein